MICDITMVLFRPNRQQLLLTLKSLSVITDEYRHIQILISGADKDLQLVNELVVLSNLVGVVHIYHRYDNIGFASGHNYLLKRAFFLGADYCLVLNPDIDVSPGSISALIEVAESNSSVSLYAPPLCQISPERTYINSKKIDSYGIKWTYSARHVDIDQGLPWPILSGKINVVDGLTGACLLLRKSVYECICAKSRYFFDDVFLAYREDAELGIRAKNLGISSLLVEVDGFFHVRSLRSGERGNSLIDLLGVRNRFVIKWRLGHHRPGIAVVGLLRDLLVIIATILVERHSLPGLIAAIKMRRYLKYTSSVFRKRV